MSYISPALSHSPWSPSSSYIHQIIISACRAAMTHTIVLPHPKLQFICDSAGLFSSKHGEIKCDSQHLAAQIY